MLVAAFAGHDTRDERVSCGHRRALPVLQLRRRDADYVTLCRFHAKNLDLSDVRTYPLKSRKNKARVEDFARPSAPDVSVRAFVDSLPNVLAAADFKAVVRALAHRSGERRRHRVGTRRARHQDRARPVLIDLMEQGFVSAIATNGAAIIHDFEIALVGPRRRMSTNRSVLAGSGWPKKPDGC